MAKFLKSVLNIDDINIHDSKLEICLIGRSNVGKSTLINSLANKNISITSKIPGRTKSINIFDFDKYRLIDLPGYGYANVDKTKKLEIDNLLFDYINNRHNLFGILQICDIRNITKQDEDVYKNLLKKFKNVYILLNKIDKVNKSFFFNNKQKIIKLFLNNEKNIFPISALKKTNVNKIKNLIQKILKS